MRNIVVVVLSLISAVALSAQEPAADEHLHVTFSPGLDIRGGAQSMASEYPVDAGMGEQVISRVQFDDLLAYLGGEIGIEVSRGNLKLWALEAGVWMCQNTDFGLDWETARTWEWYATPGFPPICTGAAEGSGTPSGTRISVDLARTLAPLTPPFLFLYAAYRYQTVGEFPHSLAGWEYVWNGAAFDLGSTSTQWGSWDRTIHGLGLGLMADGDLAARFGLTARAAYVPVWASQRAENSVMLATSSGFGHGFSADLKAVLRLLGYRKASIPYIALEAECSGFLVSTTERRAWSALDTSTSPPTPAGTVIDGIGHRISCLQAEVTLKAGVSF